MIAVVSELAGRSEQMARELERADRHGIPILPIRLDAAPLTGDFGYFLGNRQWLDLSGRSPDDCESEIVGAVQAVPDKSDGPAAAFPRQDRAPVLPASRRNPGAVVHAVAQELREVAGIFVTSVLAREKALDAYDLADPRTLSRAFRILIYVSLATAILHVPAWHESRIRYGHPVFIPLATVEELFEQIAFGVLLYAAARMFGGMADQRQFFSAFGLLGSYLLISNACLARFQLTAIKVGVGECAAELADIGKAPPWDLGIMLVAAIASIAFRIVLARSLLRAFPVTAQLGNIKTAMSVVAAIGMWMITVTVVFQPLECMLYRAFGP